MAQSVEALLLGRKGDKAIIGIQLDAVIEHILPHVHRADAVVGDLQHHILFQDHGHPSERQQHQRIFAHLQCEELIGEKAGHFFAQVGRCVGDDDSTVRNRSVSSFFHKIMDKFFSRHFQSPPCCFLLT